MSYPFEKFHHLCIVVRSIKEKVEYFESIGIGPWTEFPPLTGFSEMETPSVDGFTTLKYVQANMGDLVLQLVQPSPEYDTPQQRFLDAHGEGVYHIGFAVDDLNKGEEFLKEKGLKMLSRGRKPDQSGFSYFDTKDEAGVILLIRKAFSPKK